LFLTIILTLVTYKILSKNKIKLDNKLAISLLPFIILGSIVRVFADTGVYPRNFFTVTPGIWVIFLALVIISLLFDKKFKTKNKITIIIPTILIIVHLFFAQVVNSIALFYYAVIFIPILLLLFFFRRKFDFLKSSLNLFAIISHLFDATSTFVNITFFNYIESHIVGNYFIELFNSAIVMYPLKLLVLIPALIYLDKQKEDKNLINFFKIIIIVLGLGPGIRNFITVLLGV